MQGGGHQVAHMDVPRPSDDLDGLFLAHIQLADPHVVGVGVLFHGQDLAHHHVFDLVPGGLPAAHHGPGHGHVSGILLDGDVFDPDIGEILQPAIG